MLLGRPFVATTKMVIDVHSGKLTMMVSGETVQLIVIDSVQYPFANFPYQCSYIDYLNVLVSDPSFQGKSRIVSKDVHSKAKEKRRQVGSGRGKVDLLVSRSRE